MTRVAFVLVVALAPATLFGQATPDAPIRFDVVSVKANTGSDLTIHFVDHPPDGYRQANLPLANYVSYAYNIRQPTRLTGLPAWTRAERFDVTGKATRALTDDDRRAMLRDVLASRFGLRAHVEQREQPIYVLTRPRTPRPLGAGLNPRADCASAKCDSGGTGRPDGLQIRAVTLATLADGMLSNVLGQLVRDETGIEGVFDVSMSWRPDSAATDPNDPRPSLFTAVQEQLGLELEPRRGQVDVLVIDAIERPGPD